MKQSNYPTAFLDDTLGDETLSTLLDEAKNAAQFSTCSKKKLGCVLYTTNGFMFRGWNGPPENFDSCDPCPRIDKGGIETLHLCRAVHAERMTILRAARQGVSTQDAILVSDMGIPCKDCLLELIAAGVKEIICSEASLYDPLSDLILSEWLSKGGQFRVVEAK